MNYYTLLFHAIVRFTRYVNPAVSDQGLSDGGYWSMNLLAALYLMFALRLADMYSKGTFLLCWMMFWALNYAVFARKERWQEIVRTYDRQPSSYLNKHTVILVTLLVSAWLGLVAQWYKAVP